MPIELWLAFVAASAALLAIPGPTMLMVLSYALSQGRRVALATAAGVALGDTIAMTASLAGLGALVQTSALLFGVLKWAGAVYLCYLGLRMLRSNPAAALAAAGTAAPEVTPAQVFRHAAAVTSLNPKSIAFFVAFVPQFLSPGVAFLPQAAILTATFVTMATLTALSIALLAHRLRRRLENPKGLRWLNRTGGGALLAMGLFTATLRRATA